MSNSNFCRQQRQQEEHKSRKLLAIGLFSSIVLHGAISSAAMRFNEEPKETKKPIELIIVDAPKPVPAVIKPKPEPQKQVKVIPPPPIPEPQKQAKVIPPPPIPEPQSAKTQPAKPKIENRQTQARSSQPRRVARVDPKPQTIKPQTFTPPSPDVQPNPVQPPRPPVNPTPITNTQPQQQVLTGSNSSAPKISVPDTPSSGAENNSSFNGNSQSISGLGSSQGNLNSSSSTGEGTREGGGGSNLGPSSPVAARPTPKPIPKARQTPKCIRNCGKADYPSVLNGAEGSASVRVMIDSSGNVVNAEIAKGHSNSQINEQALIAARKLKFAPRSGESTASVRVTINFTVAGSAFERQARERQEQKERQARERQQQQERQAREQQERQQQQERQAREQQERQQQEQPSPEPTTDAISPEPSVPDAPEL
ncbi:TonB family protein [Chroococcus sp. FPU101]|uniref:TonB family protein n=1 Tax=Chroococcus sp. FPU101 TaxID=1974212 RepID=UPI001A905E72|nr:TonB family protein [Chroococcus sp. FPU101]GFE67427.1 TonB family protein [Chroococcus sp. FPU101]